MTTSPSPRPPVPQSSFDQHALRGLDPCVHCGFCLPACPTYEVTSDEADSPRGRILLMRALERGELPADDAGLQLHLDRCLGCRGCESVCPSGVVFGPALEAARARLARVRPLPVMLRVALWVLARPSRQRLLWLLSRWFRRTGIPALLARGAGRSAPRFVPMLAMLAATDPGRRYAARGKRHGGARDAGGGTRDETGRPPELASGAPHPAVLFTGCVMDGLFGHVHVATRIALEARGIGATAPAGQVCCGALAAHAGAHDLAAELARENVRLFAPTDGPIVVNSAGCGAMLKAYGDILADDPLAREARAVAARVKDVCEVLADAVPRAGAALAAEGGKRPLRVAYDEPCHLLHAQRIKDAPRTVLAAIPGVELIPLEGAERCCGSAGLYSMLEPGLSAEVLALKVDAIRRAAPDVVVTGNPGCLMQIGAGVMMEGLDVEVRHPVELLAWSSRK